MKLYLDCFPCLLTQTLAVCRACGVSEADQKDIFAAAWQILSGANPEHPPVELVADVHAIIRAKTGINDLYHVQKQESTKAALAHYSQTKETIDRSPDPFDTAVRMSIAGNIIDFGMFSSYDLPFELKRVLTQPFAVDHLRELRQAIQEAETILYLADNAGETVFDRLLIETIGKPILYAVKETPILNDALEEDAIQAGLDRVATIISSGVDTPGTVLSRASESFLKIYHTADVIIAKGQGNFEALSEQKENLFFILQAKCETLARSIGSPTGGLIVKSARKNPG